MQNKKAVVSAPVDEAVVPNTKATPPTPDPRVGGAYGLTAASKEEGALPTPKQLPHT